MSEKLAHWLMQNRLLTVSLSILLISILIPGLYFIDFTVDYRAYFSSDNPQMLAFDDMQIEYAKNDNIMIIIEPDDGDIFTPNILNLIEELTASAWEIPFSKRVDSITNFQYTRAENDDLIVENLFEDSLSLSKAKITQRKEIALNEPLLKNALVAQKGDVTGVNITINLPEIDTKNELPQAIKAVRDLVAEKQEAYPTVKFYLTGISMLNNAFPEVTLSDTIILYPIVFLVILVLLFAILRAYSGTLMTLVVVVLSALAGLGGVSWSMIKFTPVETTAPIMIMTLAIADCVHLLVSYYYRLGVGDTQKAAMKESLTVNIQPIFLTSVTTVIGFLSLNFSDSPPFRVLGNTVAIGVTIAFVLSLFFLPAILTWLPTTKRKRKIFNPVVFERFADFVIKYRKELLLWVGVIIFGLIALVPLNTISDTPIDYFDKSIKFRHDSDFMDERLTGVNTIEYSIPSSETLGVIDPLYLEKLDQFAQWLREQPYVVHVNVFTDIMKRLNMNMHDDDPAWYRLPSDKSVAAQYLLLYEMSLPFGLDLTNQINIDKSATRIIITLMKTSSVELIDLDEKAQQWLVNNTPKMMWAEGASTNMMFAYISKRNVISMMQGLLIAIILISLTLIIALKSIRLGLISMLPNFVPAAMAFGIWGIFVGEVGLGLSVVSGMTLGIVVDDTVHFLSKYLRGLRIHKLSELEAIHYAFKTVGFALVTTTIVLTGGFLVLMFSSFSINANMGIVTALTIVLALFVDFLFLPPLLSFIKKQFIPAD